MSERFLKYETENSNLPVDERGVLTAAGGGSGLDFSIIVDRDFNAKLISGSFQAIYNKLINDEVINGIVMEYMKDSPYNHYCDSTTEFNYGYEEYEGKISINIVNKHADYRWYILTEDNAVRYYLSD